MKSEEVRSIIVGIGIPGSGKTTHLKLLAETNGMVYINPDDIRETLTGDPGNHTNEPRVWQIVYAQLKESLPLHDTVLDATYTKKRDRRELIEFCSDYPALRIIAVWFDTSLEVCLERNKLRSRVVPEEAIKKMHNRLQLNPPTTDEGFSEVVRLPVQ